MVRNIQEEDLHTIYRVWVKHFKSQFEFPDFMKEFLVSFTVECNGNIIAVGGVKPILESIIIMDKDFSPRARRKALYEILDTSEFIGRRHGFNQLHAFIQEEKYLETLLRRGFELTKGKAVVRNL